MADKVVSHKGDAELVHLDKVYAKSIQHRTVMPLAKAECKAKKNANRPHELDRRCEPGPCIAVEKLRLGRRREKYRKMMSLRQITSWWS